MPKPRKIGKITEKYIENVIYNDTDYTYSAKMVAKLFSPSEIIAELASLKKQIQEKGDNTELRQFIYNSRLLLSELIKNNPKEYNQIQQYVMNPSRNDRKKVREDYSAKQSVIDNQPNILEAFHELMTVSRRHEPISIKREMEHAWQSIRRVARSNKAANESNLVISAPTNKPPIEAKTVTPRKLQKTKSLPELSELIHKLRALVRRKSMPNAKQNSDTAFTTTRPDAPPIEKQSVAAPLPSSDDDKKMAQYNYAVEELVRTEKAYVKTISLFTAEPNIKQVMADYTKDYNKNVKEYIRQGYIKPHDLETSMRNIAALSTVHTKVLAAFERRDIQGYQEGIKHVKQLQNEYTNASIAMLLKIPPELKVTATANQEQGFNNTINAIFSQTYQRITRYPMLLGEMSKPLNKDPSLRNALEALKGGAGALADQVNLGKAQYEDRKKIIETVSHFAQNPTTDQFKILLDQLSTSQLNNKQKKQLLNDVDFSKLDKQGLLTLQQFAQKDNQELRSFLNHKATAGQLIRILEKDMPADRKSPQAAFLRELRTQIAIQSAVRQDKDSLSNMTILTPLVIEQAKSAYMEKKGDAQACDAMAEQYKGVLNFVQNDMKAKVYAKAAGSRMVISFEQTRQAATKQPENKNDENKENQVVTRPRKNT